MAAVSEVAMDDIDVGVRQEAPMANKPLSNSESAIVLLKLGACPSCCLRFSFHRYPDSYEDSLAALKGAFFKIEPEDIPTPEPPCPICIGILQCVSKDTFVSQAITKIEEEKREFTTFSFASQIPIQVAVKELCLWAHLQAKYPATYGGKTFAACVPPIKDAMRWICLKEFSKQLKVPYEVLPKMEITLIFTHEETKDDWEFVKQMDPRNFQTQRQRFKGNKKGPALPTLQLVEKSLQTNADKLIKFGRCPPAAIKSGVDFPLIECVHEFVYIAGRYMKYSRNLSQTPWMIDGVRKGSHSVEELLIESIKKKFRSVDAKFSASGREDIDVRMLGTGRPFIVEIHDPRIETLDAATVKDIQNEINNAEPNKPTPLIQVGDLQAVPKLDTTILKEGEEKKTKTYCCIIWMSKDATDEDLAKMRGIKDLAVNQTTPIRVLHRRNVDVRPKMIHWCKIDRLKPHFYRMYVNSEAGTYIKEFVHGDFGRTVPNVGTIVGCEADILSLDVCEVGLEWPPRLENTC